MKNPNDGTSAAYAAGVGLSVLLFSAMMSRTEGVQAQRDGSDPPTIAHKAESGSPEAVILRWPAAERLTARSLIEKYGEPTSYTKDVLVWDDNGPWLKTVVSSSSGSRFFGQRDKNFLVQTVAYRVPDYRIEDLKRFDWRLEIGAKRDQLSARSESEAANFLTLNLADEIVAQKRSVEDARAFYAQTERLAKAGKSSAYTEGILFPRRADRDLRIDDYLDNEYERNLTLP